MGDATAHVVQILFIVAANPRIFSNPEKLGQFDRAFAQRVRRAFVGVNEDRSLVLPKCNADVAKPQTHAAEIGHIGKFLFGFGCVERNHGVRLIARIDRASIGMMQAGVRLMVEVTRVRAAVAVDPETCFRKLPPSQRRAAYRRDFETHRSCPA